MITLDTLKKSKRNFDRLFIYQFIMGKKKNKRL